MERKYLRYRDHQQGKGSEHPHSFLTVICNLSKKALFLFFIWSIKNNLISLQISYGDCRKRHLFYTCKNP